MPMRPSGVQERKGMDWSVWWVAVWCVLVVGKLGLNPEPSQVRPSVRQSH